MNDVDVVAGSLITCISGLLALAPGYVRKANTNAPTGAIDQPFATILISDLASAGQPAHVFSNIGVAHQLNETSDEIFRAVVLIQFFRKGAKTNVNRLRQLFKMEAGSSLLAQNGLSYIRCNSVQDLSQVVDTYWEERAQGEFEFYLTMNESATVDTFSAVSITTKLDNQSKTNEVNLDS